MSNPMHVVMVAAENDALPGGKVGGVGDVVRDLPRALVAAGCAVTVVTPSYGRLDRLERPVRRASIEFEFDALTRAVDLIEIAEPAAHGDVRQLVLDHPTLDAPGAGIIYAHDPPERPFATDATRFALMCQAVATAVVDGHLGTVDVLHLHDWHAALVLALREYHPDHVALRSIRCVYTVHNLALQGVRPFTGDDSSLERWYPDLRYDRDTLADPRWTDCVNPMAVGVRLADAVHVVSPSYAAEVLVENAVETHGRHGGEGLEADLRSARDEGRLEGILNGCEYPDALPRAPKWPALVDLMRSENLRFAARETALSTAAFVADRRIDALPRKRPGPLLTCVGRVVGQKLGLLMRAGADGRPCLDALLDVLERRSGLLVILGTGDAAIERGLTEVATRRESLVFLRGYSEPLGTALYGAGDLFLMPSTFEPCGISQMLAMRAGQPCLVHAVGGLKDTVHHGENGFAFSGEDPAAQAAACVSALEAALDLRAGQRAAWRAIERAAAAARFSWADTARTCIARLYAAS